MKIKLLTVMSLFVLAGCDKRPSSYLPGNTSTPFFGEEPIHLMMGQSNMSNMPAEYISEALVKLGMPSNVYNVAVGGTRLTEWQKGTPLYNQALALYKQQRYKGRLKGVFFWQGEAESGQGPESEASTWAQRFTQFVYDFRADTGEPNLKIVFMQVGLLDSYPYATVVKAQQAAVSLPNVIMTTTDGIPVDADGHHFFGHFKELAERMAVAMVNG